MNLKNKKLFGLALTISAPLILVLIAKGPTPQDLSYHQFIDNHLCCGIPNFHNVISNILFIIFGIMGIVDYYKYKERYTLSWLIFFVGVLLVAPGSAYYHWNPNNATLVWDRIPMTFGFMGLISSIFVDVFKTKHEKFLLVSLLLLGIYSVMHWVWFEDLRIYAWLQGTTILVMFYMAIMYKDSHLSMKHLVGAVTLYIIAKICESNDAFIYESIHYSGHSIKHLVAAFAVFILIKMKRDYVHHEA